MITHGTAGALKKYDVLLVEVLSREAVGRRHTEAMNVQRGVGLCDLAEAVWLQVGLEREGVGALGVEVVNRGWRMGLHALHGGLLGGAGGGGGLCV